uniref:CD99 antigen-like n=1 Tax=Jaculus jaculus TaxID=51337 RepID=UPI001E1B2B3A|nr:CD99 antigen-like [Jaculus jaculus]
MAAAVSGSPPPRLLLWLLAAAAFFAVRAQDDFDLSDALGGDASTKAPKRPPAAGDGDLNLFDGLGGHDEPATPGRPRPRPPPPRNPEHSDTGISDSDLVDINPGGSGGRRGGGGGGGGDGPRSDDPQAAPEGVIPAIVSSVAVALAGVVSGFVAYYKKKLCFKQNGQQGDAEMAARAEPPVQQTLLER